jgi:hypothetical protein
MSKLMYGIQMLVGVPLFMALFMSLSFFLSDQLYAAELANIETGRNVYLFGKTDAGKAKIAGSGGEAPAEFFACANCHGERAEGKKETGIIAPTITWQQLQRAYRRDLDGGRQRKPYDFESFKRVITQGTTSDWNTLSHVMPRYRLTDVEIKSLVLYLQQIGDEMVTGVTDNVIRIGIRLPADPEVATVIQQTLQIYQDKLNTTHGIYRRLLEFVDVTGESIDLDVFCMLDLSLQHRHKIDGDKIELAVFSSLQESDSQYALYQHPLAYSTVAAEVVQRFGQRLVTVDQMQGSVAKTDIIVHTPDDGSLAELLLLLNNQGIGNSILTLSPVVGELTKKYQNKVFGLQPPGPESVSETGQRAVFDYIKRDQTEPVKHLSQRLWTLSLLEMLTVTLQAVGKDITQQRFERVLQSHVDLDTIYGPRLSFSGSRRVGNIGAVLKRY